MASVLYHKTIRRIRRGHVSNGPRDYASNMIISTTSLGQRTRTDDTLGHLTLTAILASIR